MIDRYIGAMALSGTMRTSEAQFAKAIREILRKRRGRRATFAQLRDLIPHYVSLTDEDRGIVPTRGEPVWYQAVRNVLAHRDNPGNAIHEGRLRYDEKPRGKLSLP
jgi:hypothetical protein